MTPGLQAKLAALTKIGPRTDNATTHGLLGDRINGKRGKVAKGQEVVKWHAGYREPGDIKSLEHMNTILGLTDRTGAEASKAYLDAVYATYYKTVLYHPCASSCVDVVDGAILKAVNSIFEGGSKSFWTQIRNVHKASARRLKRAAKTSAARRKRGRPKKGGSQPAAQGSARAAGRRATKSETSARDDDDDEKKEKEEDGVLPAPAKSRVLQSQRL